MATAQQSGSTRQLVIKTGVVNRLVKELQAYKDEAAMLEQRVQAMQDSNEDEYEIKQQHRVHNDSLQMIPDSEKRLAQAVDQLQDLVDSLEQELDGTEELNKAQQAIQSAQPPS